MMDATSKPAARLPALDVSTRLHDLRTLQVDHGPSSIESNDCAMALPQVLIPHLILGRCVPESTTISS